jgi:hypothetical protein
MPHVECLQQQNRQAFKLVCADAKAKTLILQALQQPDDAWKRRAAAGDVVGIEIDEAIVVRFDVIT